VPVRLSRVWKLVCSISRLDGFAKVDPHGNRQGSRSRHSSSLSHSPVTISDMSPAALLNHSVDAIYAAHNNTCGLRSCLSECDPLQLVGTFRTRRSLQATSQRRTAGQSFVVSRLHSWPGSSTRSQFCTGFGQVVHIHRSTWPAGCRRGYVSSSISNKSGLRLTIQGSVKPCPMFTMMALTMYK
jgi:hypothetical protein